MLKVVMITRDYPPKTGGISTHVISLVAALKRLGIEVQVLAGYSDLRTLVAPLFKQFHEYDLVHVQSSPYGVFVFGRPLVVTVHAPILAEWHYYNLAGKLKSIPAFLLERITFRKVRTLLSVSNLTRKQLIANYGVDQNRIQVIGNGVDYSRFAWRRERRAVANKILLVSRLEPRKNVEEAVRTLGGLQHQDYEAKIAGKGSQREMLERMARQSGANVTFVGEVSYHELVHLYRDADIFLTTSHSEGFGLSLLEAMASGCAVIASNIPTHREIVHDSVDGMLYENPSDLLSKLKMLLSTPTKVYELGRNASDTARGYSWDAVATRVARAYKECLVSYKNE